MNSKLKKALIAATIAALAVYGYNLEPDTLTSALSLVGL